MSAKMIISQPEADQGFGLLKDIVEMVKNPKAIDEAYERRMQAAQLSDDEVKKSEEARAMIAKADSLRAELQTKQNAIEDVRKEHAANVLSHIEKVRGENARLTEWETRLNSVTAQQFETDKKLIEKSNALEIRAKKIEEDKAAQENSYNERVSVLSAKEAAQKIEDERLSMEAKKLKDKAARLAAEAAKD